MNTKHFEYCLKIAELRSINKAASDLLLSQPYLSSCLKSLESELGFSVFIRTNSGITPTMKGRVFLVICEEILNKLKEIQQLSDQIEDAPLNIASMPLSYVMSIFLDFMQCNPVSLPDTLTEYLSPDQLLTSVSSGKHRMSLFLQDCDSSEFFRQEISRMNLNIFPIVSEAPYYVAFRKNHPLSDRSQLTLDLLMQHPMVYYTIPQDKLMHFLNVFQMPAPPSGSLAATNRGQYFDALLSGRYYAIMTCWRPEYYSDLQFVPLPHVNYLVTLYCIHQKGYRLSSRERLFLHALHDQMLFPLI